MTSELIERVARAIFACHFADTADAQAMMQKEWGRQSPLMDMVRNEAQAAIAAMQANTAEQAAELAKFKALAETLAGALEAIRSEAQREEGSWLHLKRCIAAQSAETLRQYKEARDESYES